MSARKSMKKNKPLLALSMIGAIATLIATGCQSMMDERKPVIAIAEMKPTAAAAAAKLEPAGIVRFTQVGNSKVLVEASISGLKPFAEHGFHIHAVPDCSGDGSKTGPHFNPDGHPHGDPSRILRHAGAMINIKTDGQGVGATRQTVDTITLAAGSTYSIVGLPLIVHRDPDDYVSQPLGNAGPRVSCGVITLQVAPK